jgi:hypothetical protein
MNFIFSLIFLFITAPITMLNASNHDIIAQSISSPEKRVNFKDSAAVALIATIDEYYEANLAHDIWSTQDDLEKYKRNFYEDILKMLKNNADLHDTYHKTKSQKKRINLIINHILQQNQAYDADLNKIVEQNTKQNALTSNKKIFA